MLLNCVFVGLGGRSRLHLPLSAGAAAPETGQRLSGYYPVHQYRRCLCAGLIGALAGKYAKLNPQMLLFLRVGVCGGFTTFSTFSVETAGLLQSGKTGLAMLYTALSLLLGVTVVLLGQRLVR